MNVILDAADLKRPHAKGVADADDVSVHVWPPIVREARFSVLGAPGDVVEQVCECAGHWADSQRDLSPLRGLEMGRAVDQALTCLATEMSSLRDFRAI